MRYRRGSFGLLLVAGAVALFSACSNQGEGGRCDKNSGDADCAGGLVCTTIQSTTSSGATSGTTSGQLPQAVCCPAPPQPATTRVCSAVSNIFDAGVAAEESGANTDGGKAAPDAASKKDASTPSVDASLEGGS